MNIIIVDDLVGFCGFVWQGINGHISEKKHANGINLIVKGTGDSPDAAYVTQSFARVPRHVERWVSFFAGVPNFPKFSRLFKF